MTRGQATDELRAGGWKLAAEEVYEWNCFVMRISTG